MKIRITPKTLLLAGLVSTIPMKILKKQPVQFTNCIVDTVTIAKKPLKNILVVDDFRHQDVDINGDLMGDVSHGFVTSSIIEKGLSNEKVVKCNIFPKSSVNKLVIAQNLDKLLTSVLDKMKRGQKFDAINFSIGFSVNLGSLSREVGMELDAENIAYYAKDVKEALKNCNNNFMIKSLPMKEIVSILGKMDSITKKGTKIYLAAGNTSDNRFNLLSLVDDVICVGAFDKKGNKAIYSDKNSLVTRFENGYIPVKFVDDGFDITGDGRADLKKGETTALFNFATPFAVLEGTSFAAPRAIVKDLGKK